MLLKTDLQFLIHNPVFAFISTFHAAAAFGELLLSASVPRFSQSGLPGRSLKTTCSLFMALYIKELKIFRIVPTLCRVHELQPEHINVKFE